MNERCNCGWPLPVNVGAIKDDELLPLIARSEPYEHQHLSTTHSAVLTCPICSVAHSFSPHIPTYENLLRAKKERFS